MITIAWEWECPCLAGVRGEYYGANGAFVKLLSNTSQNHERKPENDVGTDLSKPGLETGVSTCLVRPDQGWST
ncbi:hypothetical protein [Spirosoma spitsbergense]|uniref:hypothetical protein n=1 Tax=Spirosoma spitsbergense TaxID=431554 RepID=UPI00037EA619|nr:hypothetical protein [Spirosoma spitsbergense]